MVGRISKMIFNWWIDLDRNKANETIDFAFSLYHFQDVIHNILSPVLKRIGEQRVAGWFRSKFHDNITLRGGKQRVSIRNEWM
ncbi:hypothetical protein [Paenibacillus sp. RC67]|uniref:hypothetical protein n=1 Tax=Paenibacillus sp. RC67 TaxID=3039392 RepID=UPI0024ACA835|nr:hypothetical protein [Paenibacillus sp. RC67]